jgi:hypothetical protein
MLQVVKAQFLFPFGQPLWHVKKIEKKREHGTRVEGIKVVTNIPSQVLMTPNSTPREVLPPQGLFQIQGWNR